MRFQYSLGLLASDQIQLIAIRTRKAAIRGISLGIYEPPRNVRVTGGWELQ
jgi:hypothetical protein